MPPLPDQIQQRPGHPPAAEADSWRNADEVRASLARYADPFVQVDVEVMVIAAAGPAKGRTIAILTIHEFETVPVLCGTQVRSPGGAEIVGKGACYVRSNQVPATTEAADHAHLRELLDLAVEKGVREFLRRARGARSTNRFGARKSKGAKDLAVRCASSQAGSLSQALQKRAIETTELDTRQLHRKVCGHSARTRLRAG